jgi:LPS-assembly protein
MKTTVKAILVTALVFFLSYSALGQRTNPVDRRVSNPIPDGTSRIPVQGQKDDVSDTSTEEGGDGELVVYSELQSVEGDPGKRILRHQGKVDVRYGIYRLRAERLVIYEETGVILAEGEVIFDQGSDQRISGTKGEWNFRTKLGKFVEAKGYTNRSNDGSVIYFSADSVERLTANRVVVLNGQFTSCDEPVPKWSFTANKAQIDIGDTIKLDGARFRLKNIPVVPVPGVSIPIKRLGRSSGFLTPAFGYSPLKGFRATSAYYQTLGNSADATLRGDLFSARGIGFGMDVRTRANARSFLDFGFYSVKDRLFGGGPSIEKPDQGGTTIYADGVHYFSNGFTAAVDIRLTSSLDFRQVFSDGIQQIISPIEVSEGFVTKSWDSYTFSLLTRSRLVSIPNVRVRTRNLPSLVFEKRPSELGFLRNVFFSFKSSLDGMSRKDEVDSLPAYLSSTGASGPLVTPDLTQRIDFAPSVSIPFSSRYLTVTGNARIRTTFYSNSLNAQREVVGKSILRRYADLSLDINPTAVARNYFGQDGKVRFRHVVEPFATYRRIKGISDFKSVIRFDEIDTVADTNEIEFGLANRIYVRKVEGKSGGSSQDVQPYELLTFTLRGKYFFDPQFGGALAAGSRNQISPVSGLTFYAFGGVPRRLSPLNADLTYRPIGNITFGSRVDYGLSGDGLRAASLSAGYDRRLFKFFQTFYYTRAVTLMPSLAAFADSRGKEAGTLRGSQWNPSLFLGDRERGLFAGASLFFDFQNRREIGAQPLISSVYSAGYAYDCCSLAVQYYTFNVGVRRENRLAFSFRLNGIGTIGTQDYGVGRRELR